MSIYGNVKKYIEDYPSGSGAEEAKIYPASVRETDCGPVFMADGGEEDFLVAPASLGFAGETFSAGGSDWTAAPLTEQNAVVLRRVFPFTAPKNVLSEKRTVGTGDRLGIATPGHVRPFERYDAFPVLAQQSVRELTLTGRTFQQVLDCASYGVFKAGFTRGFGADGDHLKTPEEVEMALECGYTMITLDCSEHIGNDVGDMSDEEVCAAYKADPELEEIYLDQVFHVGDMDIVFDGMSFKRMSLIYNEAIGFAERICKTLVEGSENPVDLEISIDETETPTTPEQHFYVASELIRRGVRFASLAPRFCGEFQKGIDYIGDLDQFEREFARHAEIARYLGYKVSVHSGSDKFSVFPTVGKYTDGVFHLKTSGTSWLEAMAVIAECEPDLYRQIHHFALTEFDDARKFYHVTTNLDNVPDPDTLKDEQLPELFENNDARQLIHITYGYILNAKNPDGTPMFYDRLYSAWRQHSEEYYERLDRHISRHLKMLYEDIN